MFARLRTPVRLPTYSQSSKPEEKNHTFGWKLRKLTAENMMFNMTYTAMEKLSIRPGT